MDKKVCKDCKRELLTSFFYASERGSTCKDCKKKKAQNRYTLICQNCHKEFKGRSKNKKYCSTKCVGQSQKHKGCTKTCSICNQELPKERFHGKICSSCKYQKEIVRHSHVCKLCSKPFKSSLVNQRYCSNECSSQYKRDSGKRIFENFCEQTKGYSLVSEYHNSSTKVEIKHDKCGRIFEVTPNNFKSNQSGCPHCYKSKGEMAIAKVLDELKIDYAEQYKIKECKNKLPLPFDFAVFSNNQLKCLIEFDGEQHFKPKFGEGNFVITQKNDKIKDDYCKMNNINLIRIPYTEIKNIPKIIEETMTIMSEAN